VVLYQDQGDCKDNSLRLWFKVIAAAYAVNILMHFIVGIYLDGMLEETIIYKVFYILLSLFSLVWMIIGTVWYYKNPTCGEGKL
jgi:hypothetical protein